MLKITKGVYEKECLIKYIIQYYTLYSIIKR